MEDLNRKAENLKAEETKENPKKTISILVFMILLLSIFTYRHFKKFKESITGVQMPKLEIPPIELSLPKNEGNKEFISPDGKLKISYPSDWLEMDMRTLESYVQREIEEKPLFLAQKLVIEKSTLAILTINKLKSGENSNAEQIIEKMKEDTQNKGNKMEVLKLETDGKETIFEAEYSKENAPVLRSKEKMISNEEIYLVSFFAFKENSVEFENEAEEIINSAQLIE